MKEIVIHCPCQSHKEDKTHYRPDGSKKGIWATTKILMQAEPGIVGVVSVQCSDITCRTYNKINSDGKYNSWYRVEFTGLGGYTISPIAVPEKHWELETVPVSILETTC